MRYAFLALFLSLSLFRASAAPTARDAFFAALKSAIAAKSTDQLLALTCTTGMSDSDKKFAAIVDQQLLFAEPVTNISFLTLPPYFRAVYVTQGKKIEPTIQPRGLVEFGFDPDAGNGARNTLLPYAIINGSYYLVGCKSTDLGWKGPPDKTLSFMVMGQGAKGIKVDAKWNVSGIEQEGTYIQGSVGFLGQYFESVTVTCADPNADLSLELMENGKDIVPPLKGKGTITFKNGLRATPR